MNTRTSRRDDRYHPYSLNTLNRRTSFTNSQFSVWKQRIDNYVYNSIGHHLDDLPDLQYREWFENGFLKPKDVSHIVLGHYYEMYNMDRLYFG